MSKVNDGKIITSYEFTLLEYALDENGVNIYILGNMVNIM